MNFFWKFLIIINFFLFLFVLIKKNKRQKELDFQKLEEYKKLLNELNNVISNNLLILEEKTEALNKIIFGADKLIERFTYIIKTLEIIKNSDEPIEGKVMRLNNFGFQINEISKILDMPQGEIKLLLDLRKEKKKDEKN